jgi:hypothetical protein
MPKGMHTFRPTLELLEDRTVPYALSGYKWALPNMSASYVPDGTVLNGGAASSLFSMLDARYATSTWQREFARALQTWASVTPLNFHFVADSGLPQGTSGLVQGDSRFGDIRVGARPMWYLAYTFYPSNSSTAGGDLALSPNYKFYIGSPYDLYSVFLHESGHALGLAHSYVSGAVMYPSVKGVYAGLSADDIAGIRAIYGARMPDAYDVRASNDTLSSSTPLTLDTSGSAILAADLTTLADVDCYRLTVPAGLGGSWTIAVDARGLSLLSPMLSVYDAAGNLVARASAGTAYGTAATVTLTGLVAGQTYTLVADGATGDVFGMGAYRLTIGPTGTGSSTTSSSSGTATSTTSTGSGAALVPDGERERFLHAHQLLPPWGGDGLDPAAGNEEPVHRPVMFLFPPNRAADPVTGQSPGLASWGASLAPPSTTGPAEDALPFLSEAWIDLDLPPI